MSKCPKPEGESDMTKWHLQIFLWSIVHTPDAAVALLNAEAEHNQTHVTQCLAGIFRHRSRFDLAWMWQTLLDYPADVLALEPHIGVIESGATHFPPRGMNWQEYAQCLATADACFGTWAEHPPDHDPQQRPPVERTAAYVARPMRTSPLPGRVPHNRGGPLPVHAGLFG